MLAQGKTRENEEGKEQPETEDRMSEGTPRYHSKKIPNNMQRSKATESKRKQGYASESMRKQGKPRESARELRSLALLARFARPPQ